MKTISQLREEAKVALSYSYNVPADLSQEKQEKLYDTMADICLASRASYEPGTVKWAESRKYGSFYGKDLETQSLVDAAGIFFDEMGNQAVLINESVNPFSESNRKWVIYLAAAGVLAYFIAPVVIDAIRKGSGK